MSSRNRWFFPSFPLADQKARSGVAAAAVRRVLERGEFVMGMETASFEREFAAYLGTDHVVGVGSGTDAIELMLRALDIGPGQKVVVPAHAPSAVAAGVMRSGAGVVFADVEPDTCTLCPESLDEVLRTHAGQGIRAALAVHLYGHPADWLNLKRVADAYQIVLLEDAAQAHGAVWNGRKAGTLGLMAAFSFYPTKCLGACGDAGAVATGDEGLAVRIRELRQYGWRTRGVSDESGINSRLDELQAAILRGKLPFLEEGLNLRRRLAAIYEARLGGHCGLAVPRVRGGCDHAFHLYVVRSRRREEVLRRLSRADIPAAIHYPVPLHRQSAFASEQILPASEAAAGSVVSLPLHPHLPEAAIDLVCDVLEGAV